MGLLQKLCSKLHNCRLSNSELWAPIPSFASASRSDCLWQATAIGSMSFSQYFRVDPLTFSFKTGNNQDLSKFSSPFSFYRMNNHIMIIIANWPSINVKYNIYKLHELSTAIWNKNLFRLHLQQQNRQFQLLLLLSSYVICKRYVLHYFINDK